MSYLLDTDWLIQSLNGYELAVTTLRRLLGGGIAISWISIAEVYDGAFGSPNPQAYLVTVRHFVSGYRIVGLDDAVVVRFAELRAYLRRRGELILDFDLLIAATALEYDLTMLTFNRRHFERIPELRIYQPEAN